MIVIAAHIVADGAVTTPPITFSQVITWVVAAVIAIVSGGVGTAVIQGLMSRNTVRAEAGRQQAEEEEARAKAKKADIERIALIQEVEDKAHEKAAEVAEQKYKVLELEYTRVDQRCSACQTQVDRLTIRLDRYSHATDALIDAALETLPLLDANAEQSANLRAAIRAARVARYERDPGPSDAG